MGAKQVIALATLRMLGERKKRCILAIEEPENNLHPHTQRSMVGDLLAAGCQTFITTHSVHVAQVTQLKYLYSLVDRGNGVKVLCNVAPSLAKGLRAVKSGFDFIDFWAVDFDWQLGKPFNHHWQDYRTRKDRSLQTVSTANHEYPKPGKYTAMVKVVDVFGCDTSMTVEVKI